MTETRERILSCACDLYLTDGFEGFSMRKLARSVGVTAPALYRHFENREDVLLEVVGEAYDELFRTLSRALSGSGPMERFAMAGEAYLDFALANPRYFNMIHTFSDFMGLDEMPPELTQRTCGVGQFWYDRVRECVDAGFLRAHGPEKIGLTLWAHAYGLISLYLRRHLWAFGEGTGEARPMSEEEFRIEFRESVQRLLEGLARGGAEPALPFPGNSKRENS